MHTRYAEAHMGWCPFRLREASEYEQDCQTLEIKIPLRNNADLTALCSEGSLTYMKGRGWYGRTFLGEVPRLGVQPNDRLDPFDGLPDVDKLLEFETPGTLIVWRANFDGHKLCDAMQHRCPLFAEELGTSPDIIAIDNMHTLYKGPVERFNAAAIWRLILNNSWRLTGTEAAKQELACKNMRADLITWQQKRITHT